MRRPRTAGHTLGEMIVTLAVFSALTLVGADLLIHALRSTASGELRQTALDESREVMYRVSDEIRNAVTVLDPSPTVLMQPGSPYLVFTTQNTIVGYRLVNDPHPDPNLGPRIVVQRAEYYAGYTAGVPGSQVVIPGTARQLTSAPSSLWFQIVGGGVPPGLGGANPSQTGTGVARALGQSRDTIQVQLGVTPPELPTMTMRTKKTLWAGIFPVP